MDMAKSFYAWSIQRDEKIRGTVVRSTTIPEDLGRISYLLTDKTGTLTQNEMVFRRLVLATTHYDTTSEILDHLKDGLRHERTVESVQRMNEVTRVTEAIKALAICHNVTPVYEESQDDEMEFGMERDPTYQASSPDEVSLSSCFYPMSLYYFINCFNCYV